MPSNQGLVSSIIISDDNFSTIVHAIKEGKQLFNLKSGDKLLNIINKVDTHIACVANNSKLLIFLTKDLPILKRGGGVQLQKIKKEELLSDIQTFYLSDGITWKIGSQLRNETDIDFWIGNLPSSNLLKQ